MPRKITLRVSDASPSSPRWSRIERLALADRHAIGLEFGAPCDPRTLVDLYDIDCIVETYDDYTTLLGESVDVVAARFAGLERWSCTLLPVAPHTDMMLVNPTHSQRRRTLTIAHEFGHLVHGHQRVYLDPRSGGWEQLRHSDAQEDEATGYALALLIPYAPLLQLLEAGAMDQAIADYYSVSLPALHMRLKCVGLWHARR